MSRQLGFPPHQGLPFEPGPPVPDGYVEPNPGIQTDPRYSGSPPRQLEAGYVGSSRFTFADTSGAGSSGAPAVAFQGVKHNGADLLYLAWLIRFDFSFDENDRIVCCLRPSFGAPGTERRIDIRPMTGAGGVNAAPPDTADYTPSLPDGLIVKSNKAPFHLDFYKQGAGGVWVPSAVPGDLVCKVRSEELDSGTSTTARYWSVELQIPTKSGGGTNWADLQASFGLYWNVVRVCTGPGCNGLTLNYDFCAQFPWPDPTSTIVDPPAGPLDPTQWVIPSAWYGEGKLGATAAGVDFRDGYAGIGIRTGGPGSAIGGTVNMTAGATNPIVARVFNSDTGTQNGVFAEFRLADFGLGPYGHAAAWERIDIHGPGNPTPPVNVGSADTDLVANWTITAADRTKYGTLWNDQCLWALLDSAAGASFAQSSIRRNLALINLSKAKHSVTVTGKGHGAPARGAREHDFMLHVVDVKYPPAQIIDIGAAEAGKPDPRREISIEPTLTGEIANEEGTVTWLHVVNGYRCTGRRLTLGGKPFLVWTHAGAFSFVAKHRLDEGETHQEAGYAWGFEGDRIQKRGVGVYYIPVGEDEDVVLEAGLEAGGGVKPGDPTPPGQGPIGPKIPDTVREGDKGTTVRKAQFLLSVEGYGFGAVGIDGVFGASTTGTVKRFQRVNGLAEDGVVGAATWKRLFALAPLQSHPFPAETKSGSSGSAVVFLQHSLNRSRRWYARDAKALKEDGRFGSSTQALLQAAQRWSSLKADGIAGLGTWALSTGPTLWSQAGPQTPDAPAKVPPTVREGEHNEAVQKAQFLLSAEGYGLAPAQVEARFGGVTKAAVIRFQKANGLSADGVVGPNTWRKLIAGAPVPRHPFAPTLRKGAKGPVVKALQQTLNEAIRRFGVGIAPIAEDGDYGDATAARVKTFQKWGAVLVDGIVGYRTWSVPIGDSLWNLDL
jgi:peptidoglycan hydrolase-like protein with peptidoglycan-binding domain